MLTPFESKDLALPNLYKFSTPKKHSLFHAIANATYLPYRTGKIETDDGTVTVSPDAIVDKIIEELSYNLTLEMEKYGGKSYYQLLDFKDTSENLRTQLKSNSISETLLDFIGISLSVQLQIVDDLEGKIKYTTRTKFTNLGKLPIKTRIILAEEKFAYSLISQKGPDQRVKTSFEPEITL